MLNINPPNYKFCPFCGNKLSSRKEEGKTRKYCKKDNWTHYPKVDVAVGAIMKKGNKVLMVKRNREPHKGTWSFPAGFVDFGEHPQDALVREMAEETGLKIKNARLWKIQKVTDDPRSPNHLVIFYKATANGEINNFDEEENSEVAWLDTNSAPEIGWKQHKKIFKLLKEQTL